MYYSPHGYWKGQAVVKQLALAAKISVRTAKEWLVRQALWQIVLHLLQHIPRSKFDVLTPNAVHHGDLLLMLPSC